MMRSLFKSDYLSIQNSNCLKGIFAVAVVICHMFSNKPLDFIPGLGTIVTSFGYLSVAFFMFLSGYGLTISTINKGKDYFDGYFKKRILPIYLVNVILIIVYSTFNLLINNEVLLLDVLQSFVFGRTVVTYGWYIQFILLFYVIFYFIFKKFNINQGICILTIVTIIYCFVCMFASKSASWYETSMLFVVGALWANNKNKVDKFLHSNWKNYFFVVLINFVSFAITYFFGNTGVFSDILRIIMKMISAILFVTLILLLSMKIRVNYKLLLFLGKYFFEIYIIQGIPIVLFSKVIVIENILLYYVLSFVCTLILAMLISPVIKGVNKMCRGVNK